MVQQGNETTETKKESSTMTVDSDDAVYVVDDCDNDSPLREQRQRRRDRPRRRSISRSRSRSIDYRKSKSRSRRYRRSVSSASEKSYRRQRRNSSSSNKKKKSKSKKSKRSKDKSHRNDRYEMEDGELSSGSSTAKYQVQDVARLYPPSLRIIVQKTNLTKIKVGTLFLVTYKGGSLGREGNHEVIIPDINVSKFHLKINYDEKQSVYQIQDVGSRNGTILNGLRMSPAQVESRVINLNHGSVLQFSQTKLLCHIHDGNATCGQCEPGLITQEVDDEPSEMMGSDTGVLSHKTVLKRIQQKYGLENESEFVFEV